jgi:hypothetical protein
LQAALERGNPIEIDAAQSFWLRCSETLRRLDLAVEIARRQEESMIPLKTAQDAMTFAAEWLRISVMQLLSSETVALIGLKSVGEFKSYFIERFCGIPQFDPGRLEQDELAGSALGSGADQDCVECSGRMIQFDMVDGIQVDQAQDCRARCGVDAHI